MKSLKRSAIILTISVAGLLAIKATETPLYQSSESNYRTLEELGWQSVPNTGGNGAGLQSEFISTSAAH